MQIINPNARTYEKLTLAIAVLSALVFIVSPAHAQTNLTTFATFDTNGLIGAPGSTPLGSFQYTNTFGAGMVGPGTGDVTGNLSIKSGAQYLFKYKANNGYNHSSADILATLSFTGTAVGPASFVPSTSNPTPGTNPPDKFTQSFINVVATFTAVTPVNGLSKLLQLNFASGSLDFSSAGGAATFQSTLSQAVNGPPGLNAFSSDFLDFNNPNSNGQYYTSEQFSISLSGVNRTDGANGTMNGPGPIVNANGTVGSFEADPTGTFSSIPAPPTAEVPEPGTFILMGMGGLIGGMSFRKRYCCPN